jgi:hypothetical protein
MKGGYKWGVRLDFKMGLKFSNDVSSGERRRNKGGNIWQKG